MFKVIGLRNFRGFEEAQLSGLSRINVLTGLNGSGKTSILEAAFLISGGANASLAASLYGFRGDRGFSAEFDKPFRNLFRNLDPTITPTITASASALFTSRNRRELSIKPIYSVGKGRTTTEESSTLTGVVFQFSGPSGKRTSRWGWNLVKDKAKKARSADITVLGGPPVKNPDHIFAQFVSPYVREIAQQDHDMVTQLVTEKRTEELVKVLKLIEPSLTNLLPLTEERIPVIYADIGQKNLLPISLLGTGLSNCMRIILPCLIRKNATILVDEFEDGLHHSLFVPIIGAVFDLARRNNNQLFISTHSAEFLTRLLQVVDESKSDDVSFYRLARKGIRGTISKYEPAEAASLLESNIDLR